MRSRTPRPLPPPRRGAASRRRPRRGHVCRHRRTPPRSGRRRHWPLPAAGRNPAWRLTKTLSFTQRATRSRSPPQAAFSCARRLMAQSRAAAWPSSSDRSAPSLPTIFEAVGVERHLAGNEDQIAADDIGDIAGHRRGRGGKRDAKFFQAGFDFGHGMGNAFRVGRYKSPWAWIFPCPFGDLFPQTSTFAHRFAAEFGADLVHRPLRRRPLVAGRVDQAARDRLRRRARGWRGPRPAGESACHPLRASGPPGRCGRCGRPIGWAPPARRCGCSRRKFAVLSFSTTVRPPSRSSWRGRKPARPAATAPLPDRPAATDRC